MHGRPAWRRFTAAVALAALGLSPLGCAFYTWRATPITDVTLSQEKIGRRQVRFTTEHAVVTLDTTRFDFPYAEGRLVGETSARVAVPLASIRRAEIVEIGEDRTRHAKPIAADVAALTATAGKRVLLQTDSGPVSLQVEQVQGDLVWGTLVASTTPSTGHVRLDLRDVRRVEVRELDGAKSAAGTIGTVAGIGAAAFLIVLLTKESCPFVYVDRGQGYELVGEAYAGAAFQSIQRDDLLPLPALADGRVTVMLRNEARETQYTDEAALVLVDHAPELRAVSTFDAKVALVGTARPPVEARDGAGRPLLDRLEARDGESVEATPEQVADGATGDKEEMVASFVAPDGSAPVLEIVGGNTPWLDLVFGRFFSTMGGRLDGFLASGNAATAGPGIRAWRQREGVDLAVEVRDADAWRPVAIVPTVGPIALRRVAVPLPPAVDADGRVTVRLRGGPGFWRIDQLALSSRAPAAASVHRLGVLSATTTSGKADDTAGAVTDGRFNALAQMNEGIALAFDLPPVPDGAERSAFLFTNGYYNVHQPIQSRFSAGTLRAVRRQPGGLTRLSRDLAAQYVARMREHPAAAATAGGAR
jgi:hypothetical protein